MSEHLDHFKELERRDEAAREFYRRDFVKKMDAWFRPDGNIQLPLPPITDCGPFFVGFAESASPEADHVIITPEKVGDK